jgi:uncharacterized protein (DUF433 family)
MLGDRIIVDQDVAQGKPVIKGSRVPVEIILGSLAGGMEINEVAEEYGLEKQDVLAAIKYLRFLLDANMPRSSAELMRSLNYDVEDVRGFYLR